MGGIMVNPSLDNLKDMRNDIQELVDHFDKIEKRFRSATEDGELKEAFEACKAKHGISDDAVDEMLDILIGAL